MTKTDALRAVLEGKKVSSSTCGGYVFLNEEDEIKWYSLLKDEVQDIYGALNDRDGYKIVREEKKTSVRYEVHDYLQNLHEAFDDWHKAKEYINSTVGEFSISKKYITTQENTNE